MLQKGDRIPEHDFLLRRVYADDKRYVKPDGTLSSRAFAPRPKDEGKLSVDVERLTTYDRAIKDEKKFFLYRVRAIIVYDNALDCTFDPHPPEDPTNDAHALITGFPADDESKPAILAKQAARVAYPFS